MISIHASNKGGDAKYSAPHLHSNLFQSTPPTKEATRGLTPSTSGVTNFNPRLQQRRRLKKRRTYWPIWRFQSTPPTKEATERSKASTISGSISIHASNKGGDFYLLEFGNYVLLFQSTPPTKEATLVSDFDVHPRRDFNPRLQQRRRPLRRNGTNWMEGFQSTPPTKEATRMQF